MADNTAANNRIVKNTLFLYIRMGFVLLISLYTTRVVLNVLGVDDYGIYNVVCGFVSLFSIFNTSFSTSINRYYNYELGQQSSDGVTRVYSTSVIIQFAVAVIVLILVETIGVWYISNKMVLSPERLGVAHWIFQLSVLSLVITIMQAPFSAAVMAYEKMGFYAVVSIVDTLLKLGFIIVLQFIDYDKLLFYGIIMTIVTVVDFLLYFLYCKSHFPDIRFSRQHDKEMFKSMLSFSGWSLLDPFSYMMRDQGTNMILNTFFGTVVNAAQGIAYQVAGAVESFTSSLATSFRPQIIQTYSEGNFRRTKRLVYSMSRLNYILQLLLVIPLCFEMPYILKLWLGPIFPYYTIVFAVLVLSVKTINTLNTPLSTLIIATGQIKKIKIVSSIIICSVIPIAIILFKLGFEPWSVYASLLFVTIVNQIVHIFFVSKLFPDISVSDYTREIALPCVIYTIIATFLPFIIITFIDSSFLRLLLTVLMSSVVIIICGYWIILDSDEKEMFKGLLIKFFTRFRIIQK